MSKKVFAAMAALCASACATPQTTAPTVTNDALAKEALAQKRFVIDQRLEERARVEKVYLAISRANLEFCKNRSRFIGVSLHSVDRYGKGFKDAAEAIGLTKAATVGAVISGSPAERAGIKPGDILQSIDGAPYPETAAGMRKIERTIARWPSDSPIPVGIKRGDQQFTLNVYPEQICGYPVQIAESDELNAYADGEVVVLQRGMLRFFANDNEMALVLGHELAHNALGHLEARRQNQMAGMAGGLVLDILVAAATGYAGSSFTRAGGDAGAIAYSTDFETEADYAGMYFIARAGFSLDNVENFWRRMAVEAPKAINLSTSHPTTPKRFLVLAATREEILNLQRTDAPLRPKIKDDGRADVAVVAQADTSKTSSSAAADSVPSDVVASAPQSVPYEVNAAASAEQSAPQSPSPEADVVSNSAPSPGPIEPKAMVNGVSAN